MESDATQSTASYIQKLESFARVPRGYLSAWRKQKSIMLSRMPAVILKSEICGLSNLVDQLGADRTAYVLKPVYEGMINAFFGGDGEVIEFQPDRLTAVWGVWADVLDPEPVLTAIKMRQSFERCQDQSSLLGVLGLKIGLDQGRVVEMIMGSSACQAYSVIGPATLRAAHLMETASPGDIKVSQAVFDRTNDVVVYEPCYDESDLPKDETQSYLAVRIRS
jgi:class 3 adenylate cyclase